MAEVRLYRSGIRTLRRQVVARRVPEHMRVGVRDPCKLSRPGWVEPEVCFRIVHNAQDGHNGAPVAPPPRTNGRDRLGPKGAFENGNISALTRRVPNDGMVSAVPPCRGNPKPPKEPRTPRVVELLRKAIEWQALLVSGKIANQVDIARQEGITRARVTQVMGML